MRADFIKRLCENEIKTTELALATSSISSDIQSMVEKLSNIKVKDVAELTKKIKYDGDIEAGEQFSQSIGAKLDQAIQSLTEIKSDIDDEVVKIAQGEALTSDSSDDFGGDFEDDFGGDDDFEEFSPDDEDDDSDEFDLDDLGDNRREMK